MQLSSKKRLNNCLSLDAVPADEAHVQRDARRRLISLRAVKSVSVECPERLSISNSQHRSSLRASVDRCGARAVMETIAEVVYEQFSQASRHDVSSTSIGSGRSDGC